MTKDKTPDKAPTCDRCERSSEYLRYVNWPHAQQNRRHSIVCVTCATRLIAMVKAHQEEECR